MTDDAGRRSGRRIHVEGAPAAWRQPPRTAAPTSRPPTPATPPPPGPGAPVERLDERAGAEQLERNRDDVRRRVAEVVGRLQQLDEGLRAATERELAAARAAITAHEDGATRERSVALADLGRRQQREREDLDARAAALLDALAPGAASAAWTQAWPPDPCGTSPSRLVRFGVVGESRRPALVPFLGTAGWFLEASRGPAEGLALAALVRVLAQVPPTRLSLSVFDPRSRGLLGALAPLRDLGPATMPLPYADPRAFADRLGEVMSGVLVDTEAVVAGGAADQVEQWRTGTVPEGTLPLVVVLDYPRAVDPGLQDQLLRLAELDGPVRPTLLVVGDPSAEPARDVDPARLTRVLRTLRHDGSGWRTEGYPDELTVLDEGAPPAHVVSSVVADATARGSSDRGPTVAVRDLMAADLESPWRHDATESLDVTWGRASRQDLVLSLRTANPPLPNLLVGGAVGQGKSNLLLTLIYGIAARYSPSEVEFHLLDFKRGLEFARFAPDAEGEHWLPHVRTLSLESDQAFGLAVLRHFEELLRERSELFKQGRFASLDAYRARTGLPLPRVVLVVDEFHELFSGDDDLNDEAVARLERLARTGRVYGVHLVLASQTVSGIGSLAVKADAIFGQFPLRMSLKNTPSESEAILGQGNKAAADLTYRGEVVLNADFGRVSDSGSGNRVGLCAYAADEEWIDLQRRLWELDHSGSPPLLLLGSEPAPWPSVPRSRVDGLELWVGQPLAVDQAPRVHRLDRDNDQGVAVLAKDRETTRALVAALVLSAAPSLEGGAVVLLDGHGAEADAWVEDMTARLAADGVGLRRVEAGVTARYLTEELGPRLEHPQDGDDGPLLVVGLALQRVPGLDLAGEQARAADPDDLFGPDPGPSGREVLQRLAREGARSRHFLVGCWNSLRSLQADLGTYDDGIDLVVTADLGLDEIRDLAGPSARPPAGAPRLGVYQRSGSEGLEVLIPYRLPETP